MSDCGSAAANFERGKCSTRTRSGDGKPQVVSARPLKQGELILAETPVLVVPRWNAAACCLACYTPTQAVCGRCNLAPLCGDCTQHGDECDFMAKMGRNVGRRFLVDNFDIVAPLRFILALPFHADLLNLNVSMKEREASAVHALVDRTVVGPLLSLVSPHELGSASSHTFVHKMCAILDKYAIAVATNVRAVYGRAATLEHSCHSNTLATIDKGFMLRLYAGDNLNVNTVITRNNFTGDQLLLPNGRRDCADCSCARCSDPVECGTQLAESSENCTAPIEQDFHKIETNLTETEQFLYKYTDTVYANHFCVTQAKEQIRKHLKSLTDPTRDELVRLRTLSAERVALLQQHSPPLSSITASVMYDMVAASVHLLLADFRAKTLAAHDYRTQLKCVEAQLREIIRILLYEPRGTELAELCRHAMCTLKSVIVAESNSNSSS